MVRWREVGGRESAVVAELRLGGGLVGDWDWGFGGEAEIEI